jgi:hypothetical protein
MKKLIGLVLLSLLFCLPASATWTCADGDSSCTSGQFRHCGTATASCNITVTSTAAHSIEVICATSGANTTITSSTDGSWTAPAGTSVFSGGAFSACAYNLNATGSATTITCTFGTTNAGNECAYHNFTTDQATVTADSTAMASGTVTDASCSSCNGVALTLSTANNYVLVQQGSCGNCSAVTQYSGFYATPNSNGEAYKTECERGRNDSGMDEQQHSSRWECSGNLRRLRSDSENDALSPISMKTCKILLTFALLLVARAYGQGCNLTATTATFAAQLSAATPGQTLCLATGNYGTFTGASKASPGVTIKPSAGASPTMIIQFATPSPAITGLIFDGTGGTFTISTGYISGPTHDVTFRGGIIIRELDFYLGPNNNACGSCAQFNNANIVLDGANIQAVGEAGGFEGRITIVSGAVQTVDAGITIKNSEFHDGCWDGVQFATGDGGARGVTIGPNNEFHNIKQSGCTAHVDSIQFVGGNGNAGPIITGNYFHDIEHCLVMFDGSDPATITNNVCVNPVDSSNGFNLGGSTTATTVQHNTLVGTTFQCTFSSGGNVCKGAISNNIVATPVEVSGGGAPSVNNYNLCTSGSCAGANSINGTPTYTGGANPTTYAGFALTAGSLGHNAGSDGHDIGVNIPPSAGPQFDLSPAPLNFGAQNVSTTSSGLSLTLTNVGTVTATVSSITISGTNSTDFAQTNDCGTLPATLAAGTHCTITVTFTPAATGSRSATASVTDTPDGLSAASGLAGSGVDPAAISVLQALSCGPRTFPGTCTVVATKSNSCTVVSYNSYNSAGSTPTMSSITDDAPGGSNTYQAVPSARSTNTAAGATAWGDMWYSCANKAGATTLTITTSTSQTGDVYIWEVSNVSGVHKSGNVSSGAATVSPASPSITTTIANSIILEQLHPNGATGPTISAIGSSFTLDSTSDNMGWAHQIVSSTGTYAPLWTQSASATYATSVVALAQVSGGLAVAPTFSSPGQCPFRGPAPFVSFGDSNTGTHVACYRTDGGTPATSGDGVNCAVGSTKFTGQFQQRVSVTVSVIAGTSTLTDSTVASCALTIVPPATSGSFFARNVKATGQLKIQ